MIQVHFLRRGFLLQRIALRMFSISYFRTVSLIIGWLTETIQKSNGNRKTSAKCTFYLGKAPEILL